MLVSTVFFHILKNDLLLTVLGEKIPTCPPIFGTVYTDSHIFLKNYMHFSFRHSGLYGFYIMKMNNKGKLNYESVLSNPSNKLNIIEIPLQSATDNNQLEVF